MTKINSGIKDSENKDSETKTEVKSKKSTYSSWFIFLAVALLGIASYYYFLEKNVVFASIEEIIPRKTSVIPCSVDYKDEKSSFPDCVPEWCGRVVMDSVVSQENASQLLKIAMAGFEYGGSGGGASILDLHSGALSKDDKFINIYTLLERSGAKLFQEEEFNLYSNVRSLIQSAIAEQFNIPVNKLYLTSPTFFSRMTSKPAKTIHDEYWHVHVDKETYGSFHYTSLLYLSEYGKDFTGGRFVFVDKNANVTVEPKLGRVSFFTSSSENPHFVEKVETGTRYAITVSFTCDVKKSIQDPSIDKS